MAVELSFCVINTEHRGLLRYCLDAVARERATLPATTEVLVLDNASTDGSAEVARAHRVEPEVLAMSERRGRAENATTLLQRARGRFCLLLDEDAELEPGAAVALHSALRDDLSAGAAGARLVRPDGEALPSAWRYSGRPVRVRDDELRRVDVVQCAAVLIRRDAAEAVDWLPVAESPRASAVEFCRRLARSGWRVVHVPAARVVQHDAAAVEHRGRLARLTERIRGVLPS